YRGKGKYYPGRIRRDRGDGTYDIDYDDGETESRVKEEDIRSLEAKSDHRDRSPLGGGRGSSRVKLSEGMKVEANYRGKGKYYPGRIRRDRGDGTYDIDYDDGESESRVKEEDIRSLEAKSDHRDRSPLGGGRGSSRVKLSEGMKVEANYRGKGKYYPGRIRRDRGDGTYDIDYDDGETESRVKEEDIRSLEAKSDHRDRSPLGGGRGSSKVKLSEGMKVEANYRGKGKYYPGRIRRDRGDGTYDIDYDDGETESRVKEEDIRSLEAKSDHRDRSPLGGGRGSSRVKLSEGMKVEANYRGKGKYYPGRIRRDRGDGTYDIDYDDGESETRVKEEYIRSLETKSDHRDRSPLGGGRGSSKVKLSEGMKVEANYRGKGKYYPGRIRRDRGDGTYDIDYDDGESETRVKEEYIRSLETKSDHRDRSPLGGGRGSSKVKLSEGMKVEANYRGKGKYYPGRIRRDRGDGTYDIDYDDGESESRVKEEDIRSLEAKSDHRDRSPLGGGRGSSRVKLSEGMKVEANYRGKGKYYPGRIRRDRGDGTYDIDYDDGETESRVKEEDIR